MKICQPTKQITALLLAALMLFTVWTFPAYAEGVEEAHATANGEGIQEEAPAGGEAPATVEDCSIVAFDPLPAGVANQEVPAGTALADLDLPDRLAATVEDRDGGHTAADVPVERWSAAPEYDPTEPGTCHFAPELSANTALEELYCNNNRILFLDLTGLDLLTAFNGEMQMETLVLTGNDADGYTTRISLHAPTFSYDDEIGYAGGLLASTNRHIDVTDFTAQTGLQGMDLSGYVGLRYIDQTQPVHTITVTAGLGGAVSGGGIHNVKKEATVIATPLKNFFFEGWYENDSKVAGANALYRFSVLGDRTLEARFADDNSGADPEFYTVTYHANGGSGTAPGTARVERGKPYIIAVPNHLTAPAGEMFQTWSIDPNRGDRGKYTPGESVTMPGYDLELYAYWIAIPPDGHTVTFNPNGGAVTPTSMVTLSGKLAYLPTPTRGGYVFQGWSTAASGGTQITVSHVFSGVTTLYAQWSGGNGNGNGYSNHGGSTGSGSAARAGAGGSPADSRTAKTTIPASAFTWDGRTLTINYDSITALGLLGVEWDGVEVKDYSVHAGSVVIRFYQDFIDVQAPGEHTVRVEFLNHTGETTVAEGTGAATENAGLSGDNKTHNPSTGGVVPYIPQNGGFHAGLWTWLAALLPGLASMAGSMALRKHRLDGAAGKE